MGLMIQQHIILCDRPYFDEKYCYILSAVRFIACPVSAESCLKHVNILEILYNKHVFDFFKKYECKLYENKWLIASLRQFTRTVKKTEWSPASNDLNYNINNCFVA